MTNQKDFKKIADYQKQSLNQIMDSIKGVKKSNTCEFEEAEFEDTATELEVESILEQEAEEKFMFERENEHFKYQDDRHNK